MLEKFVMILAAKIAPIIVEKLLALLPVIAAAVAKAVTDEFVKHLPALDIPGIPDIATLADQVRENINVSIHDIDIPILSDIFDLTEFFNRDKTG
jgi:hypothetical protein